MHIDYQVNERIALIRFNRPEKLNALTLDMYQDLGAAFKRAQDDPDIRVIVLTGSGERSFCVGSDLTESIPALAEGRFDISEWDEAHLKTGEITKPIIAAVNGMCFGGGFEIMLGTDLRIAADTAQFALPEPGIGVVPAGGTLVRLCQQIPRAHAMRLLLTADRFSASDLAGMGLINEVVKPDELLPHALDLAGRIARLSGTAIQIIKRAVLELSDLPTAQAFVREAELGQQAFTSDDARKGLDAFARGERPSYD